MSRFWPHCAVFFAAFTVLSTGAAAPGLATVWVDLVARIQAQDEAVYASSSLGMARQGEWLTPRLLGRYALYKPPLLYWLSAASVRLFGEGNWALRLPSLLAGAGMASIVFAWLLPEAGIWAALAGAILVISNHLVFVLSRVGLTDAILAFFTLLAVSILSRDPRLETARGAAVFGMAAGAAILTKSVAGLILILAAVGLWLLLRKAPSRRGLATALGCAVAIAAPWHVYQLVVHPHWFWAEYVASELLSWGVSPPGQTTEEGAIWFYAKRLAMLDPFLVAAAGTAMFRRRSAAWLALAAAVLFVALGFQYHNAAYLLPLFPALAISAGVGLPPRSLLAGAATVALLKVLAVPATWALPFAPEFVNPSYAVLAAHPRDRELIVAEPDDQFYSSTLGISKVRYAFRGAPSAGPRPPLDFEYLGITLTVEEFANLDQLLPRYRQRLREFDMDSAEPVGTTILVKDDPEIARLLSAHPRIDFYAPASWAKLDAGVHVPRDGPAGRIWLLGRP